MVKHKVGDLLWDTSSSSIGVILAYFPDGINTAPNFKYSVYHSRHGNRFFYNEDMIEKGKEMLEEIYRVEGR